MDLTPMEMDSSGLSDVIFEKVKKTYEKKCMKLKYIYEVVEILSEGEIIIHSYDNSGMGSIDLQILVKYLYFTKGDIIVNCRIGHIDPLGKYICSSEFVKSKVVVENPIYKIGRSIPIVIEGCKYTVYDAYIAVYGTDLTKFGNNSLLLRVASIPNATTAAMYEELQLEMTELYEEFSKIQKPDLLQKFSDMLFSKNGGGKIGGKIKKFTANVGDIIIVAIRPPTDDNYYVAEKTDMCADASAFDVHASIIQAYNKSLRNMVKLLSWYDDEKFEADADIWKLLH
jgi:hypothetical protein